MNIHEMIQYLKDNHIPEDCYVIDELGAGEVDGIGEIDGRWATYYSERGMKNDIKYFESEAAACKSFLKTISDLRMDEKGTPLKYD